MKGELLEQLKNYIPKKEKRVFKSTGQVLILEKKNSSNLDKNNLPAELKFYEPAIQKIVTTLGAIGLAIICFYGIWGEYQKENPIRDLRIITIVISIFFFGSFYHLYNKWNGEDSKRELIITKEGLILNGWRKFSWNDIQEIVIKKFLTGKAQSANFYLIIIDLEGSIYDFDISNFKGRSKFDVLHLINSDYLELRNILWMYRNKYGKR